MYDTSPAGRAAFLAEERAIAARERAERAVIPLPTGDICADLTAADEAVRRVEQASDAAWDEMVAVRDRAGALPTGPEHQAIIAAEHRLDTLRGLRQRAVQNRDYLERQFDAALRPESVLPPGPEVDG